MRVPTERLEHFFFSPATATPFAWLRIGMAAVLIAQALLVRHDLLSFLSSTGLVQGDLALYMGQSYVPRLDWVVHELAAWGVSEATCIGVAVRLYMCSVLLLLAGLFTRPATAIAFALQWTLANSGYMNAYGFDMYAHIFLFYLLWSPAGATLSLDCYLSDTPFDAHAARLLLRVMQIHIAVAYWFSAVEKATIARWWNGELLWRVLLMPEYKQFDMTWLAHWPILPTVVGWGALALEGLFIVFIWPPRTRLVWALLTTAMHLGIAVLLGLQIFGAIMCVLVLALFAASPEPTRAPAITASARGFV